MATQKDAVCGMQVEESDKTAQTEYQGQTFYFCSSACKTKFDAAPEEYINQADGFR